MQDHPASWERYEEWCSAGRDCNTFYGRRSARYKRFLQEEQAGETLVHSVLFTEVYKTNVLPQERMSLAQVSVGGKVGLPVLG